jgi:hypothetical protein
MLFIFSTPVLIRHLWQLSTVNLLHRCVIRVFFISSVEIRVTGEKPLQANVSAEDYFSLSLFLYPPQFSYSNIHFWSVDSYPVSDWLYQVSLSWTTYFSKHQWRHKEVWNSTFWKFLYRGCHWEGKSIYYTKAQCYKILYGQNIQTFVISYSLSPWEVLQLSIIFVCKARADAPH